MPDDNLFPEGTQTPEGDAGEATPAGNGSDPAGDAPVTMAAAAEMMSQVITPLTERLEELGRTNAQLAGQLRAPAPEGTPTPATETEDFLTRFSSDPEGAVRGLQNEGFQQIVPLASSLINSTVSNFIIRETDQIDREFGQGAFSKFFEKPLGVIMNSYRQSNAVALADHSVISREVDGLKGRQFNELVEFREGSRKSATDTQESQTKDLVKGVTDKVLNQTNLTGGLRRIDGGEEEVTDALKGYLAERQAAIGGNETGKEFNTRTNYGNSYEEFQAHQEKLKAAKGGK